jgi:hypothetical protein
MLRETGELLGAYLLGAAATVAGTLVASAAFPLAAHGLGEDGWRVAAALTARHIGGAVNYMAVSDVLALPPSVFGAGQLWEARRLHAARVKWTDLTCPMKLLKCVGHNVCGPSDIFHAHAMFLSHWVSVIVIAIQDSTSSRLLPGTANVRMHQARLAGVTLTIHKEELHGCFTSMLASTSN